MLYAIGILGRIDILWNPNDISLSYLFTTPYILIVKFHLIGSSKEGFLYNVYGTHLVSKYNYFLKKLHIFQPLVEVNLGIINRIF